MEIDQRTTELERRFIAVGTAIARERLQRKDPQDNPTLMEQCMELSNAYTVELGNGHFGNRRMLRRQELLEHMMGVGDYYIIDGKQLCAAQYGT